jgi:hypothetical protein
MAVDPLVIWFTRGVEFLKWAVPIQSLYTQCQNINDMIYYTKLCSQIDQFQVPPWLEIIVIQGHGHYSILKSKWKPWVILQLRDRAPKILAQIELIYPCLELPETGDCSL